MHVWTSCNHHAKGKNNTVGIRVRAEGTRLENNHLDNSQLVVENPGVKVLSV